MNKRSGYYFFVFVLLMSCGQKATDKQEVDVGESIQSVQKKIENVSPDMQDTINKLSSADDDTRLEGVNYLITNAFMENWETVKMVLPPLLNDKNDLIRKKVVLFGLDSTDAQLTPPTLELLNDSSAEIRTIILSRLVLWYGGPNIADRIKVGKKVKQILLDKNEDLNVRKYAALAYETRVMKEEKWNDIDAIKKRIRKESLSKYKIIFDDYTDAERKAQLRDAMRNISSDNIEQKVTALRFLRRHYQDIEEKDKKEIFNKIMKDIDNKNNSIRSVAISYLLGTEEPLVFEHLGQFLKDSSERVRELAIDWAWSRYKNWAPLPEVKRQNLIKKIEKPEVIQEIVEIIIGNKDDALVRISACQILVAMGKKDLLLQLKEENDDAEVQDIIKRAID